MAAATLNAISAGRFVLGLGASTAQLTEGLHDTPFEPPVPRMRRMVTQIRALLHGERIPLAVTTARRRLARWHEAGADYPVLLLRRNLTPEERGLALEAFRPMLQPAEVDRAQSGPPPGEP